MPYAFKHPHVSQLSDWHDGAGLTGHNDCAPASLTRYLRESGFPWPGDDASLIAHVRQRLTGQSAEFEGQPYVSVAQLTAYLESAGIPYRVDTMPTTTLTPWTLALLRGVRLAPAQYPPSWFGDVDAPDHYVLQLPDDLTNDPLAYFNGQKDYVYTSASLLAAMEGSVCYHLADPLTLAWDAPALTAHRMPPAAPIPAQKLIGYVLTHDQMLRALPQVLPAAGPLCKAGTHVTLAGGFTTHWAKVQDSAGHAGWLLQANAIPVYA